MTTFTSQRNIALLGVVFVVAASFATVAASAEAAPKSMRPSGSHFPEN